MKPQSIPWLATLLLMSGLASAGGDGARVGSPSARLRHDSEGTGTSHELRFTRHGRVQQLSPPDAVVLDDGRRYVLDRHTILVGGIRSWRDIEVGAFVRIVAARVPGGGYVARLVADMGEAAQGAGYRQVEGEVRAVGERLLWIEGGPVVGLTPETRYQGDADRRQDLLPGWRVRVNAFETRTGDLLALVIRADDRADRTIEGHEFVPHEALLVTVPGTDSAGLARELGAAVISEIPEVAVLMRWQEDLTDDLLERVADHPAVVAVEPNFTFRDPETVRRRYPIVDLRPSGDDYLHQAATSVINLDAASHSSSGDSVVVAVLDTGVDPSHHVLRNHLLDGGLDLVDGDSEPWDEPDWSDNDDDGDIDEALGHGTFVASMVALVAPRASILPYRVLDSDGGGTAFNVAVALADAIARDVDVVNLSFTYRERSEVVDTLLEKAANLNVVVVAAAGNDETDVLPFPASDGNVIAVTALATSGEALAAFANRSDAVILCAPGEELYGALDSGQLGTWGGTSFSAPLVAGVAALLRATDPEPDPELVEQAMLLGGAP